MPTLFDAHPNPPRPQNRCVRDGIAHLPGWLSVAQQEALVAVARDLTRVTARTPWGMQNRKLKSGRMSAQLMSLGEHWDYERHCYIAGADGM